MTGGAVNASRNERQKSVLLIDVARNVCDKTARLIADTKKLVQQG